MSDSHSCILGYLIKVFGKLLKEYLQSSISQLLPLITVHLCICESGAGLLPYLIYRVMLPPPLFSLNFCLSLQSFFSFSACLSPPRNLVITDFRNLRDIVVSKITEQEHDQRWKVIKESREDVC